MKDFYKELKTKLDNCENSYWYLSANINSIADKVDWCYRFKKITVEQAEELAERVTLLYRRIV